MKYWRLRSVTVGVGCLLLRRSDFSICNKFKNKENMWIQEQIMNKLGLNVIWFETFEELPGLLEQIFLKKNQAQN